MRKSASAWRLRKARSDEAGAIAALFRRTAEDAWDFLYPHTPQEDLEHFGKALRDCTVWIAEDASGPLGFCAVRRGFVEHLYVAPERQGQGIGQALIGRALRGRRRVRLWTFQRNERARRFYRQQGFREMRFTDGSANEEKEPDVMLEWVSR